MVNMINKVNNNLSCGFITIASGDKNYYEMAYNCCLSYKKSNQVYHYPFAIITEKENQLIDVFDAVIFADDFLNSVYDKNKVFHNLPFKKTIFIESDFLILGDISYLFNLFDNSFVFNVIGTKTTVTLYDMFKDNNQLPPFVNGTIYNCISSFLFFDQSDKERYYSFVHKNLRWFIENAFNVDYADDVVVNSIRYTDEIFYKMLLASIDGKAIDTQYNPQLMFPWAKNKIFVHVSNAGINSNGALFPTIHFGSFFVSHPLYKWLSWIIKKKDKYAIDFYDRLIYPLFILIWIFKVVIRKIKTLLYVSRRYEK